MLDCAGEILILTGPPGSGKTTTAEALAQEPGSAKVHLHADDFWHFIKHGGIAPYLPEAHEQNKVVIDVLAKVAEGYGGGGYFVVVDGIIGPWFLLPFKALTAPVHYVVLRPPLEVAIQRCRARGGGTLSDPEPITALYRQLASLGELERHVLRTEGHSRQDMLREVIAAVQSRTFLLSP
ncbi:AAA family ATPase [Chelatococcus sp. GCM10030263]|uniref:AAA family ATPase n=1 Tax=Chelatococcus sp. GCM10030263 TaxID=3273387 RepID=UPI003617BA46